jgi:hypothetical protein
MDGFEKAAHFQKQLLNESGATRSDEEDWNGLPSHRIVRGGHGFDGSHFHSSTRETITQYSKTPEDRQSSNLRRDIEQS